jgi:hypothetical protein
VLKKCKISFSLRPMLRHKLRPMLRPKLNKEMSITFVFCFFLQFISIVDETENKTVLTQFYLATSMYMCIYMRDIHIKRLSMRLYLINFELIKKCCARNDDQVSIEI